MFINETELKYVSADRKQGISQKSGREYDFATLQVSDGLASIDLPLTPDLTGYVTQNFKRGDSISIFIDASREGSLTKFIVTNVTKATVPVTK